MGLRCWSDERRSVGFLAVCFAAMSRFPWLLLLLSGACATPSTVPLVSPLPASSASAAPSASVAAPEPGPPPTPLPVAAPARLLLEAKSKSLESMAKELGKLLGLPMETLLRTLGPDALRTDAGLGAVVLLGDGAGEDLVPPLDFAFSLPVRSEQAFSEALARDRAQWRPRGVGFVLNQGPAEGIFCKTAISLGDAPIRAVCGPSEDQVVRAIPYLTRGLTLVDLGAGDLQIRVRFAPLKSRVSSPLSVWKEQSDLLSGSGSLLLGGFIDSALLSAPTNLFNEAGKFIDAQEGASMGVTLDANAGVITLDGVWKFHPNDSWLVELVTSHPEQGPVPDTFWQLPRESEIALFGRGVDGEMQDVPRRVGRKILRYVLERAGFSDADRRSVDDALAAFPRGDKPWALGMGGEGEQGWWLLGNDGDTTVFPAWLRRTGQALQRLAALGKQGGGQAWKDAGIKLKTEQNPAGFPQGSTLIEAEGTLSADLLSDMFPVANIPSGKTRWVLVAAPGGKGRSWLGGAQERAALKPRFQILMARGTKGKISEEPLLEKLKNNHHGFGGRLLAGAAIHHALVKANWLSKDDADAQFPILLTGGVTKDTIATHMTIPGPLLSGKLQKLLFSRP